MRHITFLARFALVAGALAMTASASLAPAAAQTRLEAQPAQTTGNLNSFEKPPAPPVNPDAANVPSRGAIISLYLNSQGSDNFAKFRGILTLDFVGTGAMEYKWGGSTCPGRDVSPENVQILVMARAHGLKVTPETKPGQGGAKCLTGFTLSG